jgi:hypothetical protein
MRPRGVRVDCGAGTFLPVCPDCSWRGLPRGVKLDAQRQAQAHAEAIHGLIRTVNAATARRRAA